MTRGKAQTSKRCRTGAKSSSRSFAVGRFRGKSNVWTLNTETCRMMSGGGTKASSSKSQLRLLSHEKLYLRWGVRSVRRSPRCSSTRGEALARAGRADVATCFISFEFYSGEETEPRRSISCFCLHHHMLLFSHWWRVLKVRRVKGECG